jgi:ankyrin repeat protein
VAFDQVDVVKQLLLMGARKNQWVYSPPPRVSLRAGTALHWAAAFNRLAVMQVLIRAGAELEEGEDLDQGPGTPLAVAVSFGNIEAARALIAAGAHVESRYGPSYSPLGEAVTNGRVDMLELLRVSGAHLSDPRSSDGASVLLGLAVQSDHPDVMRYLIGKGVPLRDTALAASDRFDPMREAVLGGKLEALQVLLKAGANPNVGWELPLELALKNNNLAVLKTLLKAGANPNLRTRDGDSMLRLAQKAENDAAVELLIASGARR